MSNPVALITGSSTGLGSSICVHLAQAGYTVYASMRNLDKAKHVLDMAKAARVSVKTCQLDVLSIESIEHCVGEILEREAAIDVLVNNAGAGFLRSTEQATEEEVRWVMDLNFHGVVRCTKAVLPSMRKNGGGRIVNISSVGGLVGQPFNEIYCAAKFAVEGYTESLATYVQPNFNIKFTAIEPGLISSEFVNSVLSQLGSTGGTRDDAYKPILEQYIGGAQKRAADRGAGYVSQTPDQVAEVVANCVQMPEPPIRMRTSEWAEDFTKLKTSSDPDGKKLQQYVIDKLL